MRKLFTLAITMLVAFATSLSAQNPVGQRVIYEMNIGMFTSAGTLSAAQGQLSSLKDLGVDIVWLMPIYPRGNSGSPYAAKNFKQVNPSYGTVNDLKNFVSKAHQLGMQVWLDWVPNHMANEADWATSNPDYFTRVNGSFVHPNGYGDVIELNYGNSALVNELNNCLKYWIDQADIDGYRCDYVSSPSIPTSYWQSTIPAIKNYKPGKTITFLAEADLSDVSRLIGAGFEYDYAWEFQEGNLRNTYGGNGSSAASIKTYVNNLISKSASLGVGRMVYLTNHDQNFNNGGASLADMYGSNRYPLTVLQFTCYGMPLIWNGQEIGGSQKLNYFSDDKINWSAVDTKMNNTIRTLTRLKQQVKAFHDGKTSSENGSLTWLDVSGTGNNGVAAYKRSYQGSEAIVLINFGTSQASVSVSGITAGAYTQWLNSQTISSGLSQSNVNLSATNSFTLPAKGYAVYVKGQEANFDGNGGGGAEEPTIDPATLKASESEISVFYECPENATICAWAWKGEDGGDVFMNNTNWPGDEFTLLGKTASGHYVYKLTLTKSSTIPSDVIFTKNGGDDANKTFTGAFTNHGYYIESAGNAAYDHTVETGQSSIDDNEISFFYEATSKNTYYVWAWKGEDGGDKFMVNTSWPGDAMTEYGTAANGNPVYKYTFTASSVIPDNIIVSYNGGDDKFIDGAVFVNHGYYAGTNMTPLYVVTNGISHATAAERSAAVYDLQGRRVNNPQHPGIYICNGRKYAVR